MVALVSSVTALGAVIAATKPFAGSRTRIYFQAVAESTPEVTSEEWQLWALVTNTGRRPSGIVDATLILDTLQGKQTRRVTIESPVPAERLVEGGRSLVLTLKLPAWDPAEFKVAPRGDPAFIEFLARGHQLKIGVMEYGHPAKPVDVEGLPKPVLPTLLCRAAQGSLAEGVKDDPCD